MSQFVITFQNANDFHDETIEGFWGVFYRDDREDPIEGVVSRFSQAIAYDSEIEASDVIERFPPDLFDRYAADVADTVMFADD